MEGAMTDDSLRAVVRLRTLGPSGLNPPQTRVVDRLRTLAEEDDSIDELDVDVWGASMGITRTDEREGIHERVREFERWADERDRTLRPAFERRIPESSGQTNDEGDGTEGKRRDGRIVTPLITLAIYEGESLRAVYPHADGDEVRSIHDGIETLESMAETGVPELSEGETGDALSDLPAAE